jgi:hypothetical protein
MSTFAAFLPNCWLYDLAWDTGYDKWIQEKEVEAASSNVPKWFTGFWKWHSSWIHLESSSCPQTERSLIQFNLSWNWIMLNLCFSCVSCHLPMFKHLYGWMIFFLLHFLYKIHMRHLVMFSIYAWQCGSAITS